MASTPSLPFAPDCPFALIGMVHLKALPGAPGYAGDMGPVIEAALADAMTLEQAGFEALLLENFNDAPFFGTSVPKETVAAMSVVADRIHQEVDLPMGINVLRCDAPAALAIAATVKAEFVRLNVHTWPVITDQGQLKGNAAETVRLRDRIAPKTQLWVDVQVKHGVSLAPSLEQEALDNVERGGAQALLVSGSGTGKETPVEPLERLANLDLAAPLLIGSGVNEENLSRYMGKAQGSVVGTSLKEAGRVAAPVDGARARTLVEKRNYLFEQKNYSL